MSLGISPGRYRRGEFVYTCMCGREGEVEWMIEHLKLAHGLTGAKEREQTLRTLPKRREFANIREIGGESVSDPDGEVTAPEDELSQVPFQQIHFTEDVRTIFQSQLTGKSYGPFIGCQVVRLPLDVVNFIKTRRAIPIEKRVVNPITAEVEIIKVPTSPIEESVLSPEAVNRLWILWQNTIAPTVGASNVEPTKKEFLSKLDTTKGEEENRRIIEQEARRFIEPLIARPFVPLARVSPTGLPPQVARVLERSGSLETETGLTQLPARYPEDWEKYLREEVMLESPAQFNTMSAVERRELLKFFVRFLRKTGRIS